MTSIPYILNHIQTYKSSKSPLYSFALLFFFISIFDAVFSYVAPVILEQNQLSPTHIGIIIGSISLFGALFDIILFKIIKEVHVRRILLTVIVLSLAALLIFWYANTMVLYLFSMALWGLIYDLRNFGKFNFMSKYIEKKDHSSAFGITSVFENLGYFIGPLIVGMLLVGPHVQQEVLYLCVFFLLCSFLMFLLFVYTLSRVRSPQNERHHSKKTGLFAAISYLKKGNKSIWTPIPIIVVICIIDAFYWTLGPLMENTFSYGGYFISVYMLPSLFIGWAVGTISLTLGKLRACYISLFIGGLTLATIPLWSSELTILVVVFISSTCIAVALPVAEALLSDYISSHSSQEKTTEATMDFMVNIGWIIGPVLAGLSGDLFGFINAFAVLGGVVGLYACILIARQSFKKKE